MDNKDFETQVFGKNSLGSEHIRITLSKVYQALENKGYDPVDQIIGYILSGDPTYITSHDNARNLIQELDREEILSELLQFYLK